MTAEKDVQVARKKGRGGEVIWAMPERKHSFLNEVFPKPKIKIYTWNSLICLNATFSSRSRKQQRLVSKDNTFICCNNSHVEQKLNLNFKFTRFTGNVTDMVQIHR